MRSRLLREHARRRLSRPGEIDLVALQTISGDVEMSELACPKCVGPLRFGTDPRGPVGTCYDCWGLWIDTPHLEALRQEYPVGTALHRATRQLRPEQASPSDLLCPFCAGEHLVQQVIRGVEVEWCPACRGIFLDKGERQRLVGSPAAKPTSALPGPAAPSLGGGTAGGWGALGVGEVLAGLAEILTAR